MPASRPSLRRFTPVLGLLVVVVAAAVPLWSADATAPAADTPTDVPDDVGLGERLALVQWLRDHHAPPPDPEDLPAMRLAYLRLAHPGTFTVAATAAAPVATSAVAPGPYGDARRMALLAQLQKQGVTPDAALNDDQLQKLVDGINAEQVADELHTRQTEAKAAADAAARAQAAEVAASAAAATRADNLARLKAEAAAPVSHDDPGQDRQAPPAQPDPAPGATARAPAPPLGPHIQLQEPAGGGQKPSLSPWMTAQVAFWLLILGILYARLRRGR